MIVNRKVLGTICLAVASFLNPLGFDILVYKLTQLTNDYWNTMYVLYGLAFLSLLLLSHLFFKFKKTLWGNTFVTLGLFLNPLGYDVVVYGITLLTKDYWMTMAIMYTLAFAFFGLFLYLYKIKPVNILKYKILTAHNKIKNRNNEHIR